MNNDYFSYGVLGVVVLMLGVSFYRLQKANNEFNIWDSLMENGRFSRIGFAFMLTLVFTTWMMFKLVVDGKMTEGYLGIYGGMWVAPILAKLFSNQPGALK